MAVDLRFLLGRIGMAILQRAVVKNDTLRSDAPSHKSEYKDIHLSTRLLKQTRTTSTEATQNDAQDLAQVI